MESDRESLVVASLVACGFKPWGEAGGSAAAPEELDPENESDPVSVAGGGPVEVPVGSFVLLEVSVSESATASEGAAPVASVGVAEGSVAVASSGVSVVPGAHAHVSVVFATAPEVSAVVAELSVASGTEAHVLVVSAAAAESSVVVAEVSVASGAVAQVLVVFAAAAEVSVVVAEVPVASGAVAHVSVVAAAPELSVVVAEVSEVFVGAVSSDDAVEAASLGIESDDVAEASETDGGGSSARAVVANSDAQRSAASTATVQQTNPCARWQSKRDGCMPGTATELPSISASSPWLPCFCELRVSHLTSGAQGCDVNRRAERQDDPPVGT